MSGRLKHRGVIRGDGRIVIPKEIREELKIEGETFYELEIYGKDKILIRIMGGR